MFADTMVSVSCHVSQTMYDVVVVGGGTAGAVAAIAAAECGKRVLLLERSYALGGSATLAQVTPLMRTSVENGHNSYISRRIQQMMIERGHADSRPLSEGRVFAPEMLKTVLEELVQNAGVEILYGAGLVTGMRDGARVTGVMVQTINGPEIYRGRTFIDATGDAQLAYLIGCECEAGNEENGENQDMSLRFCIGGVDIEKLKAHMEQIGLGWSVRDEVKELASLWRYDDSGLTDLFREAEKDGLITHEDGIYFQCFSAPYLGNGMVYFNCPESAHVHNAVDARSVTQVVLDCRQSAMRLHRFLKERVGGFENSFIASFAEIPGIRESRRIIGEYRLTEEDYLACRCFADGVAQTAYPIDIHNADDLQCHRGFPKGKFLEVPYRTMIPVGMENLLVCGRCVSASFAAQSAIRIQYVCRALGEAAGLGCALALDGDGRTAAVDGARVRALMQQKGGLFA